LKILTFNNFRLGVQDEVRLMVYFSQGEEERAFSVEAKTSSTCLNIKTYILNQVQEFIFPLLLISLDL